MKKLLITFLLLIPTLSFAVDLLGGGTHSAYEDQKPLNWTNELSAVHFFEEENITYNHKLIDSGLNQNDNFITSHLIRSNSVFMQGNKSAYGDGTVYMTASCFDADCPGIDHTLFGSLTVIIWSKVGATLDSVITMYTKNQSLVYGLFMEMKGDEAGAPLRCMSQADGGYLSAINNLITRSTDWYHQACVFSDTGSAITIYPYWNLQLDTSINASRMAATNATTGITYIPVTGVPIYYDELIIDNVAWTAEELGRQCSIGVTGSLGMCDIADLTKYLPCDNNSDCGGVAVCDTGASAKDDTYCVEGGKAGCCMGRNSTYCNGQQLTPCNAGAPTL